MKQSTSVFLMVLTGMLSGALPVIVLLAVPGILAGVVYAVTVGVLASATLVLQMHDK